MIKGLKLTLLASLVTLSGVSAFAIAPTLRQIPDVLIGDQENNIGTDNNLFVFPNAFKFDDYASDGDTTVSTLKWSFNEGDEQTTPSVITGLRMYKVNGKNALSFGSTAIASDAATSYSAHLNPALANELRVTSSTASFHNILFSPLSVYQTAPTTPTYTLTGTPYPNPQTNPYTAGTTYTAAAAGKVLTFFVSDGTALDKKDIIVKTIDNTFDSLTGGSNMTIRQDDNFTTDIRSSVSGTGWTFNRTNNAVGPPTGGFDAVNGALTITTSQSSASPIQFRVGDWQSEKSDWISWAIVGSSNYVRVKYYTFVTGVSNPLQENQVPDIRVRAAARFAQSAILELLHNQTVSDPGNTVDDDLEPSLNSAQPSVLRVDMAPVFVPAFATGGEGVLREIENYSIDPEDNGTVEMTESVIMTYPKSAVPDSQTPVKNYTTSPSDAGDLHLAAPSDLAKNVENLSNTVGEYAADDGSGGAGISVTESAAGITMDTSAVNKRGGPAGQSFGIATRELFAGSDLTQRVRVEYNKLYKLRYHLTSTQASNKMPEVRMRVHTIGFAYTQKFEVGGAYNTGGGAQSAGNNLIALQSLPGVGTQNPDKISSENGGYYTIIMNTPLATDLNPTNAAQPLINAQPGTGVNAASRRDIKVGLDLIDSLSSADLAAPTPVEHGNLTWDKAEARVYNQLSD